MRSTNFLLYIREEQNARQNLKDIIKRGEAMLFKSKGCSEASHKAEAPKRRNMKKRSCGAFSGFERANRGLSFEYSSRECDRKQCSVSNGIQILCSIKFVNPKTFLIGAFKTEIVVLGFGSERVNFLKRNTVTINGMAIVIRKSNVFGAAAVLFTIEPTLVIARTFRTF